MIRRREFITLLGGVAAAWPLAVRAQQSALPVIGYMDSLSPDFAPHLVTAFREGLRNGGYVEGQNAAIEYRWAHGQYDRLPALADELVARQVALLVAVGGTASGLAAKAATSTIPVLFQLGSDPVKLELVASLNRPGANITGVTSTIALLGAKRFDVLHHLAAKDARIAVFTNPANPNSKNETTDLQDAAQSLGRQVQILYASSEREVDTAFKTLAQDRPGALILTTDPFFTIQRYQIVTLANHYGVPTIYYVREWAVAGGLMSYGPSFADAYRQVGEYAARILKGAKPAELPVMQSTKFELFINLKTAKTYDFAIPPTLLALADEVIE